MTYGILWDNDGVLVDTEGLFYDANREIFAEQGIQLTHEHFFDWFLCDNIGAWHLLEVRGWDAEDIRRLRADRNDRYSRRLQDGTSKEISGINEILQRLHKTVRMGIVTSSRLDHFQMVHENLSLLPYFDFIVTEQDYRQSKPAPDPYLLGLEKLALPAARCLAIEDSPRGLQSAVNAGLRCVVIRNAFTRHYAFEGAHLVLDSHAELYDAIKFTLKE